MQSDTCSFNEDFSIYICTIYMLTGVSLPLSVLCAYFIIIKSPEYFNPYKWYLLSFHTSTVVLDLLLSIGSIPCTFLPLTLGYNTGILTELGVSTLVQNTLVTILVDVVLATTVVMFLYKMHAILPTGHIFATRPKTFKVIVGVLLALYTVSFLAVLRFETNDQQILASLKETYPCLRKVIDHPGFSYYVINEEEASLFNLLFNSMDIIITTALIIFSITTIMIFLSKTEVMSDRTRQLQRRLVVTLIIQTLVPFVVVMLPCVAAVYIVIYQVPSSQYIGNLMFISLSFHGILNSVFIIMLNNPYFKSIKGLVKKLTLCK